MTEHYDVAISYAAEDRTIARRLTKLLENRGIRVFFDEQAGAELWGQDLHQYLKKIYEESRLCIAIVSESYANKQWTQLEYRNLIANSLENESFTILPIVVGHAPQGLLSTVAYLDWSKTTPEEIATTIVHRLNSLPPVEKTLQSQNYHVIMRESGWSVKRSGTARAASVHKTQEEAISAARDIAQKHSPSEVVIHMADGTIASREPFKPKKS